MQDPDNKRKQLSERHLEIVRNQTEKATGNAIGVIVLKQSSTLDKLSVSALIGAGAILTLCISNSSGVLSVISGCGYGWMMSMFMLSALSGFFAKITYSIANSHIAIHCEMYKALEEVHDKYGNERKEILESAQDHGIPLDLFSPRTKNTMEEFAKTFPENWRPFLLKSMNRDSSDSGTSGLLVNAWKFVSYQFFGFTAQIVFFFAGFVIAVGGFAS